MKTLSDEERLLIEHALATTVSYLESCQLRAFTSEVAEESSALLSKFKAMLEAVCHAKTITIS